MLIEEVNGNISYANFGQAGQFWTGTNNIQIV